MPPAKTRSFVSAKLSTDPMRSMLRSLSRLMEPLPNIFSLSAIVDLSMVLLMETSPLPDTDEDSMKQTLFGTVPPSAAHA
jgi:hypothetical protein